MEVSKEIVLGAWAVTTGLLGLIWRQLTGRIKTLEDTSVCKDYCTIKEQLQEERVSNMHYRMTQIQESNKKDHEKLDDTLEGIQTDVKTISSCVTTLAAELKIRRKGDKLESD